MKRRNALRSLLVGAASAKAMMGHTKHKSQNQIEENISSSAFAFLSKWHRYQNMNWIGEELWAQRLQDFCIREGKLVCTMPGENRTVTLLTHQLSDAAAGFQSVLKGRFLGEHDQQSNKACFGFRLGSKGKLQNYRSAIFTGKGHDIGITRQGFLFIGDTRAAAPVSTTPLTETITLELMIEKKATGQMLTTLVCKNAAQKILGSVSSDQLSDKDWEGNIALLAHTAAVAFKSWQCTGKGLSYHPDQMYGPVYFAQYTVSDQVLKLTAQLGPMDLPGARCALQLKKEGKWKTVSTTGVHPLARTAHFRLEKWQEKTTVPYRVVYEVPLQKGGFTTCSYEGSIHPEPHEKEKFRILAMSCNADYGFPDEEVVVNASKHNADLVVFLGDQFYEANGGFGVQMAPLEKSTLDYLRKWYMFGWSYRELFRHRPMIALPDDHDVYHGNIWGSGGRATIAKGTEAERQDTGGYKMPADWVNMAQITQTSHMPDPFDPTPVSQQIGVYYTKFNYGGIHFAVIEDRKFKSAPKDILPEEAGVWNGYAANSDYDRSKEKRLEAELLGERQSHFLKQWLGQNTAEQSLRILLSASPLCCLQTLPEGSKSDSMTRSLTTPKKGEYVLGDAPTRDMDSNGWPQNRRDEMVKLLDKKVDLHLVGDQHLPAVVQYGSDAFEDGCFCFTVPALANLWPRRWWPSPALNLKPMEGKPAYTGNFLDGFGNKMTVHAVANPHVSDRQPAELYNRSTGYGVVVCDKKTGNIELQCWKRYTDPDKDDPGNQYEGWPVRIQKNKRVDL